MKETILSLAVVALTISAPAYANGSSWDRLEYDQASEAPPIDNSIVPSLLRFRSHFASAKRVCNQAWLRKAYDPNFQLVEGSGWLTGYKAAVEDCKRGSFSAGWDSTEAVGLQIRVLGPDAVVVTGSTKLSDNRSGVWVRWVAGYVLTPQRTWAVKFAQEHRVPAGPPGPPVPPNAPRGFSLGVSGSPSLASVQTWESYWTGKHSAIANAAEPQSTDLKKFRSAFSATVRSSNASEVRELYAPDFTITHGSGYVEGRETRAAAVLRPNARLPELVDGPFLSSKSFGSRGVVLFQALPFVFPGGASGYIRALTVLDQNPNSPENYRIRVMIINSFDWEVPRQRIPSGCEPPSFGSPTVGEAYPNCAVMSGLGQNLRDP